MYVYVCMMILQSFLATETSDKFWPSEPWSLSLPFVLYCVVEDSGLLVIMAMATTTTFQAIFLPRQIHSCLLYSLA